MTSRFTAALVVIMSEVDVDRFAPHRADVSPAADLKISAST